MSLITKLYENYSATESPREFQEILKNNGIYVDILNGYLDSGSHADTYKVKGKNKVIQVRENPLDRDNGKERSYPILKEFVGEQFDFVVNLFMAKVIKGITNVYIPASERDFLILVMEYLEEVDYPSVLKPFMELQMNYYILNGNDIVYNDKIKIDDNSTSEFILNQVKKFKSDTKKLDNYILQYRKLPDNIKNNIDHYTRDILRGLRELKDRGYRYGDMKGANTMYDPKTDHYKIIDLEYLLKL